MQAPAFWAFTSLWEISNGMWSCINLNQSAMRHRPRPHTELPERQPCDAVLDSRFYFYITAQAVSCIAVAPAQSTTNATAYPSPK